MSDLQNALMDVVKSKLGSIEVQAIQQMADDARALEKVRDELEDVRVNSSKIAVDRDSARADRNRLAEEVADLKTQLTTAEAEVRVMEREAAVLDYLKEDRNELREIIKNAYKHYTHRTTRQEVVPGGTYATNDGMGNVVQNTDPGSIADLNTETSAE